MTIKCPKCQHENPDGTIYCGKCTTPLRSPEDLGVTETIETPKEELTRGTSFADRYEIIEELGRGGMGKVYRVEDTELKQEIALKLIKPEIVKDKNTIERFRNELKIARNIRHKNVCGMFDLGESKGSYFITMEYIRGEDLKSLIRKMGLLSAGQAISITKQVCDGLDEAHRLGVVHRDLKPQNIMIDTGGIARIMDFGIARSLEGKGITGAGVMIGTPEYMSPEQVEGKDVDPRSDIYSLGIILYEMVTGKVPFKGDTPFIVGMKQKSEMPQHPKDINAQIPDDLNTVILKCLEKEKEKRFQSVGELRSELENIRKGIPTTERIIPERKPLTSKEITVQFSLKKAFIPALIVFAVAIIAVVIWQLLPQKGAIPTALSDKPSLAIVYFENNTGDESLDHWRKALCELLIADLTQSKHIRVMSSDRLLDVLNDLDQAEARSLSSTILKQVAARGGSSHILRGSYTKAGEQFRIDAILQEISTMESVGSERIEGTGDESFLDMVDELTRKVKTHFQLSEQEIAEDIDEDVAQITTSSLEAMKHYIEGRKYHLANVYEKSIEEMEKAVAIDPGFAMAYRSMAMAYSNIGFVPRANDMMKKALDLADRLPAKERFFIQADFLSRSEKTMNESIEAYKNLLDLYPDDSSGRHNLAVRYSTIGKFHEAIECYEINRKNEDLSLIGYGNLASVYRDVGSYDESREVIEEALKMYPDSAVPHQELALHYRMEGKYNLALAEINKAFALEPAIGTQVYRLNFLQRARIHYFSGNLNAAAKDFWGLYKQKEPQAIYVGTMGLVNLNILQGKFNETKDILKPYIDLAMKYAVYWPISEIYIKFAYIDLRRGDIQEVLRDCDNAIEYALKTKDPSSPNRKRRALRLKGLAYLHMNSIEESIKTAEELRASVLDSPNPKLMHYYHHLKGMIDLQQDNFSEAIKNFTKALALQTSDPHDKRADYIESLAKAYAASGDIDRAQENYEKITSTVVNRLSFGDVYARSFYELGKIYEQKDWKGKAIEQYEKFLDLWKNADPGLLEVEDARKRLEELKN
jgi:tetratricopeptide (TPR) repeat protein/tRNA A-37 threonylcarbamoyl transferase component Bud32